MRGEGASAERGEARLSSRRRPFSRRTERARMIVWEGAALNNIDRITTVDNFARLHFVVRGLADLQRGGAKAPQVPWRHRGEGLKDRMIVWEGAALDNIDRTIAVNNFATSHSVVRGFSDLLRGGAKAPAGALAPPRRGSERQNGMVYSRTKLSVVMVRSILFSAAPSQTIILARCAGGGSSRRRPNAASLQGRDAPPSNSPY